jgi:hypothetical protein
MTQPLKIQPEVCRILGRVLCYPSLGRFGLESLALLVSGGLVSPAEIANIIGGIFPIAL